MRVAFFGFGFPLSFLTCVAVPLALGARGLPASLLFA
jgi:hypothetical protein